VAGRPFPWSAAPVTVTVREAAVDLLLGGRCVGCGAGGRVLCPACRDGVRPDPAVRAPRPCPRGLSPPWSATTYEGVVRAAVVGHKERGLRRLRPWLSTLLAVAVAQALSEDPGAQAGGAATVLLVPVPSRRASVRARGHDPTYDVVAGAARLLGTPAHPVRPARLLRCRPGVVDQAGLDAMARRDNLAGSMAARAGEVARWARRGTPVRVVVCDDVLTTGSTLAEAQRALGVIGVPVTAHATVAATPRRHPSGPGRAELGGSSAGGPPAARPDR